MDGTFESRVIGVDAVALGFVDGRQRSLDELLGRFVVERVALFTAADGRGCCGCC